jgi:hypothetical protein
MNSKRHVARKHINLVHFTHPDRGARGGLFIGEIKDMLILSKLQLIVIEPPQK